MCSKNIFGNAQININLDNSSVSSTFDTVNCTTLNATTANIHTSIISTNLTAPLSTITTMNGTTGNITTINSTTINNSGSLTSDSMTCDNTLNTDFLTASADISCDNLNMTGDISCEDITVVGDIDSATGTIDTFDSTTATITTANITTENTTTANITNLNVTGDATFTCPRNATETNEGAYIGYVGTNDYSLNLVSNSAGGSILNFTEPSKASNASIAIDNTNKLMGFFIEGVEQMEISASGLDIKDNSITTTATLTCDELDTENLTSSSGNMTVSGGTNFGIDIATNSGFSTVRALEASGVITQPGFHAGAISTNYGSSICLLSGTEAFWNATTTTSGVEYLGSMRYNKTDNMFRFYCNSNLQMTLDESEMDLQTNDLITSGSLISSALTCNGNSYLTGNMINLGTGNFLSLTTDDNITCNGNTTISGSLTVDTNTLYVDNTNNRIGIGTLTPESALHVVGARLTTPTAKGCHLGYGSSSDAYGIEICSSVNNNSVIDFTEEGSDYRGRILYNPSLERFDFSANGALQFVLSNNEANFQNQLIKTTGDLNITTNNTLYTDSTNGRVGIGTSSPLSSLHVVGDRDNSPASVGIHMGASSSNDYGIEICSNQNEQSLIDFVTNTGSDDWRARIMYDDSNNEISIKTDNKGIVLDSGTDTIQLLGNTIVEPGKVFNANIDSTRGQIMSFLGEESSKLAVSAFDFRFGNGQASSGSFGVCVSGDMKLKRWIYQNNNISGTAFTTSTLIVFRVWSNGVGTANYIYCDFSDTSRSNTTRRRCQGRFSSLSTSYSPVSNTITDAGDGAQISLETITLSGPGVTNNDHRINLFMEILEDMD